MTIPPPLNRPLMTLDPDRVGVGGSLRLSGAGFAASSSVTLTGSLGALSLTLASLSTNEDGGFTVAVTLPAALPPGTYTLTATDPAGNRFSAMLVVMP